MSNASSTKSSLQAFLRPQIPLIFPDLGKARWLPPLLGKTILNSIFARTISGDHRATGKNLYQNLYLNFQNDFLCYDPLQEKYQSQLVSLWGIVISCSKKLMEAETWYNFYGLMLDYNEIYHLHLPKQNMANWLLHIMVTTVYPLHFVCQNVCCDPIWALKGLIRRRRTRRKRGKTTYTNLIRPWLRHLPNSSKLYTFVDEEWTVLSGQLVSQKAISFCLLTLEYMPLTGYNEQYLLFTYNTSSRRCQTSHKLTNNYQIVVSRRL